MSKEQAGADAGLAARDEALVRVMEWQGRGLPWLAQFTHIPYDRLKRLMRGVYAWDEHEKLAVACALQVPPEMLWPASGGAKGKATEAA
jgi:hypothetical protein